MEKEEIRQYIANRYNTKNTVILVLLHIVIGVCIFIDQPYMKYILNIGIAGCSSINLYHMFYVGNLHDNKWIKITSKCFNMLYLLSSLNLLKFDTQNINLLIYIISSLDYIVFFNYLPKISDENFTEISILWGVAIGTLINVIQSYYTVWYGCV